MGDQRYKHDSQVRKLQHELAVKDAKIKEAAKELRNTQLRKETEGQRKAAVLGRELASSRVAHNAERRKYRGIVRNLEESMDGGGGGGGRNSVGSGTRSVAVSHYGDDDFDRSAGPRIPFEGPGEMANPSTGIAPRSVLAGSSVASAYAHMQAAEAESERLSAAVDDERATVERTLDRAAEARARYERMLSTDAGSAPSDRRSMFEGLMDSTRTSRSAGLGGFTPMDAGATASGADGSDRRRDDRGEFSVADLQ